MYSDCGRRARYGFALRSRAARWRQERIWIFQTRSRLARHNWMNDMRCHHDYEFVLAAIQALAREQLSENRNIADTRNLLHLLRDAVIHQPCNREALPVRQAHVGFDAVRRQRGNYEALQRQSIREIQ